MIKRNLPNKETIAIGKRIAKARNDKNLTQEELAYRIEVTPSLIGQYEKGKAGLTAKRIYQLMRVLEVDMAYILSGNDPEEKIKAHTEIEKKLLEIIRDIPPDKQELFIKNIKALADTFTILSIK